MPTALPAFPPCRRPSEMSVEELVRVCCTLPPEASAVTAVSPALPYLDSRAMAAFMKDLAKSQQLSRAMEVFDWLKSLPPDHELFPLCDVYTFTTAISLMGPSQQLRRALELIGEMRARGLQCNVHTYSALMNVCIKVRSSSSSGGCSSVAGRQPCVLLERACSFCHRHGGLSLRHAATAPAGAACGFRRVSATGCVRVPSPHTPVMPGTVCSLSHVSVCCPRLLQCDACDLALDVFKQMHEDRIRPNVVTYNTLVDVYGKTGQWDKAVQVLDDMREQVRSRQGPGGNAGPCWCQPRRSTAAAAVAWREPPACPDAAWCARVQDLEPEVRTFNTAIIACNMCGQPQEALKVRGVCKEGLAAAAQAS